MNSRIHACAAEHAEIVSCLNSLGHSYTHWDELVSVITRELGLVDGALSSLRRGSAATVVPRDSKQYDLDTVYIVDEDQ